ncbi:MAG: N-acetyltransferase [Chloroflexi bacterium]|nr:N-acetyltransferase [Chloroflexota bacterium]
MAVKAALADGAQVQALITHFADAGEMLHRSLAEVYENIRDFWVVRQDGQVLGCVALHVVWADLAELKSLAVREEAQHGGLGGLLVEAVLRDARELGLASVFCLTYRPSFFERFGFQRAAMMELPRKVWTECVRCSKFPDCGEIALVKPLTEASPWHQGQLQLRPQEASS